MTTKRVLAMLGISVVVWACSSRGTVQFADAWIDVGEAVRDAASDSAAAQIDLTAPCQRIGSRDILQANGDRYETFTYAADFRDPAIDPATIRGVTTVSCGNVVMTETPDCPAPACSDTVPPRPDCAVNGSAFVEAGHAIVMCGSEIVVHHTTAPFETTPSVSHYTTVRLVLE